MNEKFKQYILENIDPEGYGIEVKNEEESVNFLRSTFLSEKKYHIETIGRLAALTDWFGGLPSACNIEYRSNKILEILESWGEFGEDASEEEKDKHLNQWFKNLARAAFSMMYL